MRFPALLLTAAALYVACDASATGVGGGVGTGVGAGIGDAVGNREGGAAPPLWDTAPAGAETWGPETLPATITINGVTETAVWRYEGADASLSGWTATYGDNLPADAEVGTGSPDFGQPGPWTDGSLGLTMGAGDYVFGSAAANDGAFTTGDFAIECVLDVPPTGAESHLVTRWRNSTTPYWYLYFTSTSNLAFGIHDGSASAGSATLATSLVPGSKILVHLFADRSGSAAAYVNGASSGSVSISAAQGSINRSASKFLIGTYDSSATGPAFGSQIDFCQAWHRADWMDTGSQAAVALARFNRWVSGNWGLYDGDEVYPSTQFRTTTTYARICDPASDTTRAYVLGKNWIAKERSCDGEWLAPTAATSSAKTGPLIEDDFTNLALQSADMSTTWGTVNSTIDTDEAADLAGSTTMDAIDGSGAGEHGVSQAITLTAADHTWSMHFRPGNQAFAYLDVSTITNAWAYFDLDTCSATSNGVAANPSTEFYNDAGGNTLCRVAIGFVGTAASHTVRALCAEADGDKEYTGAADDCYMGWAQVSNFQSPGSYVATTTASAARGYDDLKWTLPERDPDQTTIIVDAHLQDDGFDTGGVFLFTYTDGGSANEVIAGYTVSNTTRGNWYDVTSNVTVTRPLAISDGERHIVRLVTDVATTTANVCADGECTSGSSLNSVGSDYDTFTYGSRTATAQPFANYWRVRMYDVAALPD